MRKTLLLLAIVMILSVPSTADVNQRAKLTGENVISIKVDQVAYNYGAGDIAQDVDVKVSGNIQLLSQDSLVAISDSDYEGDVNNTIKGVNIIKIDLDQYAKNKGSGNVAQGMVISVEGNLQTLDQGILVAIA